MYQDRTAPVVRNLKLNKLKITKVKMKLKNQSVV